MEATRSAPASGGLHCLTQKDTPMIDPYDRTAVVLLLRRTADHIAQGISSTEIHTNLHQLSDHLEQED